MIIIIITAIDIISKIFLRMDSFSLSSNESVENKLIRTTSPVKHSLQILPKSTNIS